MSNYQLGYNATTKVALVQYRGDIRPNGTTQVANFAHTITPGTYGLTETSTIYTKVRALMGEVLGVQNMQRVEIDLDTVYTALDSFVIAPATVTKTAGQTQQLTITPTPSDASNTTITTWVSSNTAKATVSASGLVTAVATGTATITATSQDGSLTATRLITVS